MAGVGARGETHSAAARHRSRRDSPIHGRRVDGLAVRGGAK